MIQLECSPTRWVHLHFQNSFWEKEDIYLKEKLIGELGGIASRCVSAYRDLCERGGFIQPQSSKALERQVMAASDPFTEFVFETFEVDHSEMVIKTKAYARFTSLVHPTQAARRAPQCVREDVWRTPHRN